MIISRCHGTILCHGVILLSICSLLGKGADRFFLLFYITYIKGVHYETKQFKKETYGSYVYNAYF